MGYVTEFFEIRWRPPIVVLASLVVLYYGSLDFLQAVSSAKWPKVSGLILSSQVVQPRSRYHPAITYDYGVGPDSAEATGQISRLRRSHHV